MNFTFFTLLFLDRHGTSLPRRKLKFIYANVGRTRIYRLVWENMKIEMDMNVKSNITVDSCFLLPVRIYAVTFALLRTCAFIRIFI